MTLNSNHPFARTGATSQRDEDRLVSTRTNFLQAQRALDDARDALLRAHAGRADARQYR